MTHPGYIKVRALKSGITLSPNGYDPSEDIVKGVEYEIPVQFAYMTTEVNPRFERLPDDYKSESAETQKVKRETPSKKIDIETPSKAVDVEKPKQAAPETKSEPKEQPAGAEASADPPAEPSRRKKRQTRKSGSK